MGIVFIYLTDAGKGVPLIVPSKRVDKKVKDFSFVVRLTPKSR